ncbi:signal peptidase I [Staphylococcus gallinarum]|uniref:Signal peptidase I n=1 Tax=Staphylococcus gallinarum TaxID=1293 RepID=A0A3A0VLX2_STAGA|nr:signal peptidase I [Staphylococcus gallinarum]RIP35777.1 signal peptidase I [Staphylococcus gallinarum]
MRKEIMEWFVSIVVAVALVLLIMNFVAKPYTVKGDSMDPTLKDGERVVVNLFGYKFGDIKKGNVVVFHATKDSDYVKRVIGTAGDNVEYKKDKLYVNGKKVDEPYLDYNEKHKQYNYITGSFKTKDLNQINEKNTIPKDKLLVLGDNREVSKDSRSFGLIDKDQVVGKVSFSFWPLNEMKFGFDPDTDYDK